MRFIDKIKNNFLALAGNKISQGRLDLYNLSDKIYQKYNEYIGETNNIINLNTIKIFLQSKGINNNDIDVILYRSGFTKNKKNIDELLPKSDIKRIFDCTAAYIFDKTIVINL